MHSTYGMISLQINSETRIPFDFKVRFFNEAKTDKYKIQINTFPEMQQCDECDDSRIKWWVLNISGIKSRK